MRYTVLVVQEGTFEIEADSAAEALLELDTYGEADVVSAVEYSGGGFAVQEISLVS